MKVRHKRFESVSWYFGFLSRLKFLRNIKLPTLGNTEEKMERSITISITTHSLTHCCAIYHHQQQICLTTLVRLFPFYLSEFNNLNLNYCYCDKKLASNCEKRAVVKLSTCMGNGSGSCY